MTKPECRPGTYATNGATIMALREASCFKNREEFCDADPQFSIPTLDRAESGGCIFKTTLFKLARKLGVKSWKELLLDPADEEADPQFEDPILQTLQSGAPFSTFDEGKDGADLMEKIQLLLNKKIPFIVIAFAPANSVDIELKLELRDAVGITNLYRSGQLAALGIINVFRSDPRDTGYRPKRHPQS